MYSIFNVTSENVKAARIYCFCMIERKKSCRSTGHGQEVSCRRKRSPEVWKAQMQRRLPSKHTASDPVVCNMNRLRYCYTISTLLTIVVYCNQWCICLTRDDQIHLILRSWSMTPLRCLVSDEQRLLINIAINRLNTINSHKWSVTESHLGSELNFHMEQIHEICTMHDYWGHEYSEGADQSIRFLFV